MRIIINNVDFDDVDEIQSLLEEIQKQYTPGCGYTFRDGSVYFVKRTKSGFSIFKDVEALKGE